MILKAISGVLASLAFLASTQAHASQVVWTFNDVVFDDGGTLYGSFTSESVDKLLIYTTAGSSFHGAIYFAGYSFTNVAPDNILRAYDDLERTLDFTFAGDLDVAGTLSFTGREFEAIAHPDGDGFLFSRNVVSGTATGVALPDPPAPTPVPEPASWAMMIAGFGLVGATLRHRQTIGIINS
jgi:hypothetical protein